MEQSYTVKDLLSLLIRKIWWIVLGAVVGASAMFSYSKFYLPLEYSSHISMYVQSYKDINSNNYSDINNSK